MSREPEPELHAILAHYGDFWSEQVSPFFDKLYARSGLDKKTQELIVTALLALRGWETGVRTHGWQALEAGATPDEVRGAVLVTLGVGGVTSAARGVAWLEPIIEEFAASRARLGLAGGED